MWGHLMDRKSIPRETRQSYSFVRYIHRPLGCSLSSDPAAVLLLNPRRYSAR